MYEVSTVKLRIQIFWDVMLCHSGVISSVWKELFLVPLTPQNECTTFIQNAKKILPSNTASYPRRPESPK